MVLSPFFQNLQETEALVLGETASRYCEHRIADFGFILLVVNEKLGLALNAFHVQAVLQLTLHHDDAGFLHLVARDDAPNCLGMFLFDFSFSHYFDSALSFSLRIVMPREISRRSLRAAVVSFTSPLNRLSLARKS